MIELKQGEIYESTSGLVKYDGVDRFNGEQTFRFKRLDRIGTDYVLPSEIEKFLCIEKTREELAAMNDELVAMNEELLAALEYLHNNAIASGADMGLALDVAVSAIAKAKAAS